MVTCVSAVTGWLVGTAVSTSVGCGLGDAAGGEVGVPDTTVVDPTVGDRGVGVDTGAQAAIKISARMSATNCLVKNSQPVDRDTEVVQAHQAELVERIARAIREDGTVVPLKGIRLHRFSSPNKPLPSISEPAFSVIAQGSKEL
jgi:hypothetical protein